MIDIDILLENVVTRNASDLHILVGHYPTVRVDTKLYALKNVEVLTAESAEKLLMGIVPSDKKEEFLANKELDFGYNIKEFRFRVNYYYQRGTIAASFRIISPIIRTLEELGLPAQFHELTKYESGLILVTGPTGEGKSTTLAAMINEINMNETKHIITIEDPVEYIYPQGKSIVSQRELHQDTYSWTRALGGVLREDPDVVAIGEMRDFDTIQAALTIAETGHLVYSTLHTSTAPEAINRIIDIFPPNQQPQIRYQLASVLKAVVCQRLLPTASGDARVPAVEILINMRSVAALIRENKIFMLDNVIETGEDYNMLLFEKHLMRLYKQNLISKETAFAFAQRPGELMKFIT